MSEDMHPITESDLIAYADGTISPDRRALVADRITRDPNLKSLAEAFRRQNEDLRRSLDPVLDEPVPFRLITTVRAGLRTEWRKMAAAACLAFTLGIGSGWIGNEMATLKPEVSIAGDRAALAYTTFAAPRPPMLDVDAKAVQKGDWLKATLGRTAEAPTLESLGLELIGGRVMMGKGEPAALLVYRDARDHRLALMVRGDLPVELDEPAREVSGTAVPAIAWARDGRGIAVAGEFSVDELRAVSELIQQQHVI